jgi:crotonobetainyl-CoA:carnitine CoA-transferase CaiB-like acyl-CoA transferase
MSENLDAVVDTGAEKLRRPLDGIRVVECGVFHAGPGACAILGDLGAEVIKVEPPGEGDPVRRLMKVGIIPFELPGKRSLFCEGANRNKKGVTINLKTERGRELLYLLVSKADVFLTNLRPKAVENLKISYDSLKKINYSLIYCSVSAFGEKGPDRDRGGFDYQGQARSGLMFSMGEENGSPAVSQFGLVDQVTAIMSSHQILAALFMRERTGLGQEIRTSILGSAMFLNYFNILMAQLGGFEVPRHTRLSDNPLRNYYRCRDGRWLMMTLTPPDKYWPVLCRAIERPDLVDEERFNTDQKRINNSSELVRIMDEIFATRTCAEWFRIFGEHDLFCAPVNRPLDLTGDEQVLANNYLVDLLHPTMGLVKVPDYPCTFSECRIGVGSAAPELGEHTREVLGGLCDLESDEMDRLMEEGVI